MNAASPSAPDRPLIITVEPLSRTSALADTGACSVPGASSVISTGMFCRSSGGTGAVALMSNFSGRSLALALPVILTLRSAPMLASALMPSRRFSTRSRRLENITVPSVTMMRSIAALSALPGDAAGLADEISCPRAFAQQRHVQHRLLDDEFGDLRSARPQARQRHVGLHAADGDAAGAVAVFRILQRDVVQRHVERRPDPDLAGARDGQPVAGLALDPRLDFRGQEARGHADDQQQDSHHDDGGDRGAGDFQYSHVVISRPASRVRIQPGRTAADPWPPSLSRNGKPLKVSQK